MKDLNKTYLMKIINNNSMILWNQVHIVDGAAYITDGYRVVKLPLTLIKLEPEFICKFEDLKYNDDKTKVKSFVDKINREFNVMEKSDSFKEYVINVSMLYKMFNKTKNTYFGNADNLGGYSKRFNPIVVKINKHRINAQYLLEILKITKDKQAKIFINEDNQLDLVF